MSTVIHIERGPHSDDFLSSSFSHARSRRRTACAQVDREDEGAPSPLPRLSPPHAVVVPSLLFSRRLCPPNGSPVPRTMGGLPSPHRSHQGTSRTGSGRQRASDQVFRDVHRHRRIPSRGNARQSLHPHSQDLDRFDRSSRVVHLYPSLPRIDLLILPRLVYHPSLSTAFLPPFPRLRRRVRTSTHEGRDHQGEATLE